MFSQRRLVPELMDGSCCYHTFRACLVDLAKVNRLTLAYRPTLCWLARCSGFDRGRMLRIMDVGSGYGDTLRRVAQWAVRRRQAVQLTGVDLNPFAARAAAEATSGTTGGDAIRWTTANALDLGADSAVDADGNNSGDHGVDVVISALFTHHLTDAEIVVFIRWMEATAQRGWFINDLHRHWVPHAAFWAWSRLMRWHPFVRHDGPVSIARAFVPADWRRLCAAAGLAASDITIRWWFPFRLCVGRIKR